MTADPREQEAVEAIRARLEQGVADRGTAREWWGFVSFADVRLLIDVALAASRSQEQPEGDVERLKALVRHRNRQLSDAGKERDRLEKEIERLKAPGKVTIQGLTEENRKRFEERFE